MTKTLSVGTKVTAPHREGHAGVVCDWMSNESKCYDPAAYIPVRWEFGENNHRRYIERIQALTPVIPSTDYMDHDTVEVLFLSFLAERGFSGKTLDLVRANLKENPGLRGMVRREEDNLLLITRILIWGFNMGWERANQDG